MSEIKEFIKTNKLSFKEGSRNTSIVILIGFSQHLGLLKPDLENELHKEISKDPFLQEELDRLWSYCFENNYKDFWKTKKAKSQYKF